MFYTILFIVIASLIFYAGYRVVHWLAPSWGTVLTNIIAAVSMVVDFSAQLPWGSVLESKEAAVIAFAGASIGNILARITGNKTPVGSGQ